jgi:DNA-binding Lrp family transcriptional regulator
VTKPQDIVVALKLCLSGVDRSFAVLASELGMSASEVHGACSRLVEARLLDPESRRVRRKALQEFLRSGVPYAFPAQLGELTRGIPTAWAAPAMVGKVSVDDAVIPVWPDPDATRQGAAVEPLYRSVPVAAKNDSALYDLLALVDALRIGRARERKFAEQELERLLSHEPAVKTRKATNG